MMVAAREENSAIRSLQSNYDGSYFLRLRRGCVCLQKIMIKRRRENEISSPNGLFIFECCSLEETAITSDC